MRDKIQYYLIRSLTFPLRYFPYSWIRALGNFLGIVGFYSLRHYRKRTLSNLALASKLQLTEEQIVLTAKESFKNLAINCLEYPRLGIEKNLASVIRCENPEIANNLQAKGQGIIFFCAHLANWEVLFLDGTTRMKGIAIGKSIKNKQLYQWILSIRERNGGKIVSPHNALKEGLRALKKGMFLGIVGDQGMPTSGYAFPFLGRRAWTSTAPALLAYRTGSPVIFAETKRTCAGYKIHYSDPIWPDLTKPMEEEIVRIMDTTLALLEKSVQKAPGEWLWQHNRWKQQTPNKISKKFRHDCICLILPPEKAELEKLTPHLSTLREIYPSEFISLLVPKDIPPISFDATETLTYENLQDTLLNDFRFKLVFNFTNFKAIAPHYLKRSAFEVLTLHDLRELAKPHLRPHEVGDLSHTFKRALYRSNIGP